MGCGPTVLATSGGDAEGGSTAQGSTTETTGGEGGASSGAEVTTGDSMSSGASSTSADASGTTGSSSGDASSGATQQPPWRWSEACIEGVDGPPVGAALASELLFRLLHEGRHHVTRVKAHAAGMDELGSEPFDYDDALDGGSLTAEGLVSLEPFGSQSSQHEVEFVCYTGGHGGFGPVALDGRVEVIVVGVVDPAVEDFSLTVSGELRLGGGAALSSTSPAVVSVEFSSAGGRETVSGTIGGHDASAL